MDDTFLNQPSIILVGPRLTSDQNNVGGATVSFELLIAYMQDREIDHLSINTQKHRGVLANVKNVFFLYWSIAKNASGYDAIFLNTSRKGIVYLLPLLILTKYVANCQIILRPFGGHLANQVDQMNKLVRYLFLGGLKKIDLLFLQTRELIDAFGHHKIHLQHLPTARKKLNDARLNANVYQKRFLFLGQIREAKGIDTLLNVKDRVSEEFTLHLYGPITENRYEFLRGAHSIYKGELDPEQVQTVLAKYDVLILPTHYDGEGYPGVIIEAYARGIPVIATEWKAIPEIVIPGKTGFLIPIQAPDALLKAMCKIDEHNYPQLCEHVRKHFNEHFDFEAVGDKMMKAISNIPYLSESKN